MSEDILDAMAACIGQAGDSGGILEFNGLGAMPSAFRTTDFAAAAIAAAGLGISALSSMGGSSFSPSVSVDRRLASFWFQTSLRERGWSMPPLWDAVAGDYVAADGWIRLHTNAPHHRAAALAVLGVEGDREKVAAAVLLWKKDDLETAVVKAGGCAAAMRSLDRWAQHGQGAAVQSEPLAHMEFFPGGQKAGWRIDPARPLSGIKVLDLTRILAGPVATRFLAGYGAQVLRIDPLGWEEPGTIPEVSLGKQCARLDLKTTEGLAHLKQLVAGADVMVHGYRSDALERLGMGADIRRELQPGLVDVSLDAFGWTGPWKTRRGFDSLVQMSSGLADAGMRETGADKPVPLPVQALDHGTGYLMAATVLRGLHERAVTGRALRARFSLARTAALLARFPAIKGFEDCLAPETDADWSPVIEETAWGPAQRLLPPLDIVGVPMRWNYPAGHLGRHDAVWL